MAGSYYDFGRIHIWPFQVSGVYDLFDLKCSVFTHPLQFNFILFNVMILAMFFHLFIIKPSPKS